MARHGSLESLERPHSDAIIPLKPRKKEVELSDHIQFLITEKTVSKTSSSDETSRELAADEGDIISDGEWLQNKFQQIFSIFPIHQYGFT